MPLPESPPQFDFSYDDIINSNISDVPAQIPSQNSDIYPVAANNIQQPISSPANFQKELNRGVIYFFQQRIFEYERKKLLSRIISIIAIYENSQHRYQMLQISIRDYIKAKFDLTINNEASIYSESFGALIADRSENDRRQVDDYKALKDTKNENESDAGRRYIFASEISIPSFKALKSVLEKNFFEIIHQNTTDKIVNEIDKIEKDIQHLNSLYNKVKQCDYSASEKLAQISKEVEKYCSIEHKIESKLGLKFLKELESKESAIKKILNDMNNISKQNYYCGEAARLLWHGEGEIKSPVKEKGEWSKLRSNIYNFLTPLAKHGFYRPVFLRKLSIENKVYKDNYGPKKKDIEQYTSKFFDKKGCYHHIYCIAKQIPPTTIIGLNKPEDIDSNSYLLTKSRNGWELFYVTINEQSQQVETAVDMKEIKGLYDVLEGLPRNLANILPHDRHSKIVKVIETYHFRTKRLTLEEEELMKVYQSQDEVLQRLMVIEKKENNYKALNPGRQLDAEKLLKIAAESAFKKFASR